VKRAEVLALDQQKGVFLSVAQTARQLGISPQIVIEMIKLGLLETEPLPETDDWLVTDKSIKYCVYRLAGLVGDPVVEHLKATLDLAMAAEMLAGLGLNEADLFKAILNRQVKSYCYHWYLQDLSQLVFTKSNISAYLRKAKKQNTLLHEDDPPG
jgi:hypothetical protein